ncbi:nuclear transport factor 2 family protein [Lacibacter sp. H407]|uniref:nuclear transport factor 2 family protein n=1 Tax=Lacibacter sp. H407 TaxID=3133423 RepID=UPI0030C47574
MRKEYLTLVLFTLIVGCRETSNSLSEAEKKEIKAKIIESYKKHIEDLKRLDYNALMPYYVNNEDQAVFVDGKYWGGYEIIEKVWRDFCENTDTIIYWNLSNSHVYPFSKEAASFLVEFDNLRIHKNGDTVMGPGSFALGMQKINGNWKITTVHATHNYTKAPWLRK